MATKRGLGKGLNAIIGEAMLNEESHELRGIEIPLDQLTANPFQPRAEFDPDKLEELAESIRAHGVLQPIVVRRAGENYQIIAGERRWRAAQMAGLQTIPAVVKELDDPGMIQVALIENLQREDLNPIEEASAYRKLMDEFSMTQEQLSGTLGKSRSTIANAVRLLNLPDEIQEHVSRGRLTGGHARCLLALDDAKVQLEVAKEVIDKGLTVRQTEELVRRLVKNVSRETIEQAPQVPDPDVVAIIRHLSERLGTKVKITGSSGKGKVEIEYYSEDDLGRILDIILGIA
ncbi:MAG: ParB/RepB/Spo0J family partition protein [Bacillota bacterium]|jgi:ParB family chromosome partitioning protein|nr:ParB/RepB/Spo0J family partition protein [Bacillota bacterium]